jgi:phosphate transport system permease protein
MELNNRKLLDKSTTVLNTASIVFMIAALLIILTPIIVRGLSAYVFMGTIEHRKVIFNEFKRGNPKKLKAELVGVRRARKPIFDYLDNFGKELSTYMGAQKRELKDQFRDLKKELSLLFGVLPEKREPVLLRNKYGQTRMENAREVLDRILFEEIWDYSDPQNAKKVKVKRVEKFKKTGLEPLFNYIEQNFEATLRPRFTIYLNFLFDKSKDAHFFGGIFPEITGTFYLAFLAIIFAVPFGVMAAVYLTEFAGTTFLVGIIRTFINTLAGVPSIVFGLFGLAFFINTIKLSQTKSVLVGSASLAIMILPTIIRTTEEALVAVPEQYKEASLSMGASKIRTIISVTLPAAFPGILTGIILSMGRAAGETAPIIFTAAVSVGKPLRIMEIFTQPTPALSWNIYNLCTEHEAVDSIRHVQFGMVFTLIMLVLVLNISAIILRAKILKKLRG